MLTVRPRTRRRFNIEEIATRGQVKQLNEGKRPHRGEDRTQRDVEGGRKRALRYDGACAWS